jgi:hypothetical protein
MPKYLISFEDGAMTFPDEDLPEVARAAMAVVEEARAVGVWVFGDGIVYPDYDVVGTDGSVTSGPFPAGKERIGGFSIIDVPTRDDALRWAAKIAVACRCAQDVRQLMGEPELD